MNKLIAETNASGSLSIYHAFAAYAAEQLPYIWMPNSAQMTCSRRSCPSAGTGPSEHQYPRGLRVGSAC
jgi:hypothetical protein